MLSVLAVDLEEGLEIGLAAVASLCLLAGFLLMLANRKARAEAAKAAKEAAEAASTVARTIQASREIAANDQITADLQSIDWGKVGELLDKFPENDRGPLVFVVVGALGWLLVAMIQGWINFSVSTPTPAS